MVRPYWNNHLILQAFGIYIVFLAVKPGLYNAGGGPEPHPIWGSGDEYFRPVNS